MATNTPFGNGPFGTGPWPHDIHQIAGIASLSFTMACEMELTWAQPTAMCETGTWTLTSLPSGPPNDQLELAA